MTSFYRYNDKGRLEAIPYDPRPMASRKDQLRAGFKLDASGTMSSQDEIEQSQNKPVILHSVFDDNHNIIAVYPSTYTQAYWDQQRAYEWFVVIVLVSMAIATGALAAFS